MAESKFTYEEVHKSTLDYFKGDELATQVWINKYCLKDYEGNLYELNPSIMHRRIAREIFRIDQKYKQPMSENEIFELIENFKYLIPAGGSMAGIGNKFQISSLSNCFVIDSSTGNKDSYGGIFHADQELVQLMKRRGGVGHDISHLRPNGTIVNNSSLSSPGIVTFMERYSNSTREVAKDGRRGALMLSLSVKHPDIESFIDSKLIDGKITGANISVKITDEFMNAVLNNQKFTTCYPLNDNNPTFTKEIDASKLWKKIVHNAWKMAEPGVLFWDTIIKESIPDCYGNDYKTISTNPCGEVPLCAYDSCRLLAINLFSFVINPYTKNSYFDFDLFKNICQKSLKIMDDIIDLELEKINLILDKINSDPENEDIKSTEKNLWEKIYKKCKEGRRTGVGVTAEGDMLAALGLRYGTKEATEMAVKIHKEMALNIYKSSVELAKLRGSFKFYDKEKEKNNPFIKRIAQEDKELYNEMIKNGRRNIACLSIAPTGSVSILAQTTSGIEPVFKAVYKRRRKVNPNDKNVKIVLTDINGDSFEEFIIYHPKFKLWMELNGYDIKKDYTNEEIDELISKSPYYLSSANEINWIEKVHMQGAIQKWCDHSISITHNLPSDVREEVIDQLYKEAWKSGCKGITVYRDGCRNGILVSNDDKNNNKIEEQNNKIVEIRPKILKCDVLRFKNCGNKWIAFVGILDGEPYEIFTGVLDDEYGIQIPDYVNNGEIVKGINKDGNKEYDFQYFDNNGNVKIIHSLGYKFDKEYWNYAKLISGILRYKMPLENVLKLINGLDVDSENINTWKNGVKRALKKYIKNGTKAAVGTKCMNCGEEGLIYQEGCLVCTCCGYSKCG